MPSPRETFKIGAALFRDLEALLLAERAALAGPDPKAIAAANDRRAALLSAIAAWEEEARALCDAGTGAPGLMDAVAALPAPERPGAKAALERLATAARSARHQAAVSHIVVERSLEAIGRTIDVLTGTWPGTTYGPQGDVARGARRGLVERAG
jgi:hypothetical protein